MTVERKVLFPNVLVEVFNQGHLDAVFRVANHLGYVSSQSTTYRQFFELPKPWTTIAYFGSNAELCIFTCFTKAEAEQWHEEALNGNAALAMYLGAKFKTLRKVSIEFDKLNLVTESRDNQAVLSVIPRHEYEVVAPVTPVDYLRGAGVPNDLICAPYGSNEFPECTCLGVDANTRKTCRMAKAYGGTCNKIFANLQKATHENKVKVIEWVRTKAENPIVNKVVVWYVLATSKIVSVVKRAFNFLRGNK